MQFQVTRLKKRQVIFEVWALKQESILKHEDQQKKFTPMKSCGLIFKFG